MNYLEREYLYATEQNLATLVELATLKSSSKSRIDRQMRICARMLTCAETVVYGAATTAGDNLKGYPRVLELTKGRYDTATQFYDRLKSWVSQWRKL